jgi:hypothetical protein
VGAPGPAGPPPQPASASATAPIAAADLLIRSVYPGAGPRIRTAAPAWAA